MGGDFILDHQGCLVFSYHSDKPADRPSIEQIVAVLKVRMIWMSLDIDVIGMGHHWFRLWLGTYLVPIHYLKQMKIYHQ